MHRRRNLLVFYVSTAYSVSDDLTLALELTRAYEQADWQKVEKIANALNIEEPVVKECYNEAVKWTADLLGVHS